MRFAILSVGMLLLFVLNLFIGSVDIPFADVLDILTGGGDPGGSIRFIVLGSRLPQVITALLAGSRTCRLRIDASDSLSQSSCRPFDIGHNLRRESESRWSCFCLAGQSLPEIIHGTVMPQLLPARSLEASR